MKTAWDIWFVMVSRKLMEFDVTGMAFGEIRPLFGHTLPRIGDVGIDNQREVYVFNYSQKWMRLNGSDPDFAHVQITKIPDVKPGINHNHE
jgi:hypothetical protein